MARASGAYTQLLRRHTAFMAEEWGADRALHSQMKSAATRSLGDSGRAPVRQWSGLAELRYRLNRVSNVLDRLQIHPLLDGALRLRFIHVAEFRQPVVLRSEFFTGHRFYRAAIKCALFSRFLAHYENVAAVLGVFVGREGHACHQVSGFWIHVLLFSERIEVNLAVEEHTRDVVGRAVVGGLAVSRIPFGRIANFLPSEIMELDVDGFDFFRLGPRQNLGRDILVKILVVAFGGDAFITAAVSMYGLDGQPSVRAGGKLQIAGERADMGNQAVSRLKRHARACHAFARQHRRPDSVADLLRAVCALPHGLRSDMADVHRHMRN